VQEIPARPQAAGAPKALAAGAATGLPPAMCWPGFPALGEDLRLVGLRPAGPLEGCLEPGAAATPYEPVPEDGLAVDGREEGCASGAAQGLILTVQNEGPCRRRLVLPPAWRVVERLNGLDQPLPLGEGADPLVIRPWQLCCWRIELGPLASAPG